MAEQINDQDRIKKLIRRNTNHLLELINQILDLRKLESGRLSAHLIQADVVQYLRYILESFHSLGEDKQIKLTFKSPLESLVLDYDLEKLLRIVSNLLSNALKFTPAGGEIVLYVKAEPGNYYNISVKDTGIGIPSEKLPYTKEAELAESFSETVFAQPVLPGGGISESRSLPEGVTSKLPNLLIVEDNPDVLEYMITFLEEDYNLQFAADGQEGIEKALEQVPDIIISDVMMPRADGFILTQTLKTDERTSHIPIVLLTAKADVESKIAGLQRGADAYLAKPFDKRELGVQLENLLKLRQRLQERYASLELPEPSKDEAIQQEDEFIIRIREIILENLDQEGFGVTELCKKAAMSRTQLHNKIKSLTNKPTSQLIRFFRMQKASQLLKESELNVSQVSLEVGISNLSYFSRIFANEMGLSPQKYREKERLEQ